MQVKITTQRWVINPLKGGAGEQFRYLGTTLRNQKSIHEVIKSRLKLGNAFYHSEQNLLSSSLPSKDMKIKIHTTVILLVVLYFCEAWSHIERGTYTESVQE